MNSKVLFNWQNIKLYTFSVFCEMEMIKNNLHQKVFLIYINKIDYGNF